MAQSLLLGIDAGGTKTTAALADQAGTLMSTATTKATDLNATPGPAVSAINHVVEGILAAFPRHRLRTIAIGLAGLDTPQSKKHVQDLIISHQLHLPAETIIITNDSYIGLLSASEVDYGICLIAGTGSNCYGLTPDGNEAKAGDWGYLFGDQGSGFALGQKILQQAMKEYDGRVESTGLIKFIEAHYDINNLMYLSSAIHQQSTRPVSAIASITNHLPQIAHLPSVQQFIQESILEMTSSFLAVYRRLTFSLERQLPVVLVGGLFRQEKRITQPLKQSIHAHVPHAHILRPRSKPYQGALRVAQDFHHNLTLPLSSLIIRNNP